MRCSNYQRRETVCVGLCSSQLMPLELRKEWKYPTRRKQPLQAAAAAITKPTVYFTRMFYSIDKAHALRTSCDTSSALSGYVSQLRGSPLGRICQIFAYVILSPGHYLEKLRRRSIGVPRHLLQRA